MLQANAKRNSLTSDLAIFHVFVTVSAFQNCLAEGSMVSALVVWIAFLQI